MALAHCKSSAVDPEPSTQNGEEIDDLNHSQFFSLYLHLDSSDLVAIDF